MNTNSRRFSTFARSKFTMRALSLYLIPALGIAFFCFFFGYPESLIAQCTAWAGGFIFWTFAEYMFHRYLYHLTGRKKNIRLIPYFLFTHGLHHKRPTESGIGFLPILQGYSFLLILTGLFYLFMKESAFLFSSGFILGYCLYTIIHFAVHHYPPPMKWLAPLWEHHILHHTEVPNKRFGVTTTLWDRIFNSFPRK